MSPPYIVLMLSAARRSIPAMWEWSPSSTPFSCLLWSSGIFFFFNFLDNSLDLLRIAFEVHQIEIRKFNLINRRSCPGNSVSFPSIVGLLGTHGCEKLVGIRVALNPLDVDSVGGRLSIIAPHIVHCTAYCAQAEGGANDGSAS
jgi:hypothetical protein